MADFKYKGNSEFRGHHRSYDSILPCQNKILARKYDTAKYDAHRSRIANQRATVDNGPPKPYMHLHLKLKKVQLEEERIAVIERDNRKLLEKMSKIMRTQGQVDNRNVYEQKSLNFEKRRKELQKIALENQAILKRIQSRRPNISAASLDNDYNRSLDYGANLTRFPPIKSGTSAGHMSRASSRQSAKSTSSEAPPSAKSERK